MTNLERTIDNLRKYLRPSEILKSNNIVLRITACMKNQFSGPFDEELEQQEKNDYRLTKLEKIVLRSSR